MPVVRDPLNPKISLWHMLAYLLRWEREKNGLSLAQRGKIANAAPSTVSNIEAGRRKIDERQAKILDEHFQTGGLFELMLWYARRCSGARAPAAEVSTTRRASGSRRLPSRRPSI